ncbi:opine metallophore biosynthesis dehydrogenase [Cohnella sp. GbtcB17]|uniref:opine metallophore biosynthesis dehydrogenase n=1 Tax=Cohnella sp. GbtcB17 TaxID=2824762 RepID=UPI001C3055E5|nr:opine metallophore biosynthesis dehydrogenase [Cohnella sp. GbtcB17]
MQETIKRILIAGTGPASVQMATLLKNGPACEVAVVGRRSIRSAPFFAALHREGGRIRVEVQNDKHAAVGGECRLDRVYEGYETVDGAWDTVMLTVTADAYITVLSQMCEAVLRQIRCAVLLSPTFGSNILVSRYLNDRQVDAEVVSFSTYLGDTRWIGGPSGEVVTAAVKNKVYIGSTRHPSANVDWLRERFARSGMTLEPTASPIEAETRNLSLYVHPPLFMNDNALEVVFGEPAVPKYVYKLYPEGPITPGLIRGMLAAWKEISAIVGRLGQAPVNLLKFMTDDGYPVRPESLPRPDIEAFPDLAPIHQEYLLYVRYASLLIDPYSEPDRDGRYFDFSAVSIRSRFINEEGCWDIPRMPKEDYYRTKIIQGVARRLDTTCPTIDRFVDIYERHLEAAALALKGRCLSDAFNVQSFAADIKRICDALPQRPAT